MRYAPGPRTPVFLKNRKYPERLGSNSLGACHPAPPKNASVQKLLDRYYTKELNLQEFKQLHHQLSQKLSNLFGKLQVKARGFQERLQQSDEAVRYWQQGDLLMAYLHLWQPGMKSIVLADFETEASVTIAPGPEKMPSKMLGRSTSSTKSSNSRALLWSLCWQKSEQK